MATAGEGNNDTGKGTAMPFTLSKLAYFACDDEARTWYDRKTRGLTVELNDCCVFLMMPGDRRRFFKPLNFGISDLCSLAAFNGHLDCLQQAHVAGIPWNWRTTEVACRNGNIECLMYLHRNGCETGGYVSALAAACAGRISTLEYCWKHKFKLPKNVCTLIARFGSIESLRYLRSIGFSWDVTTTAAAAYYNQLDFLKYLHQNGCPWDATSCFAASKSGNLECLEYAHNNGCEWDQSTCHAAAQFGHLECLKYAHKNGCEWSIITTMTAAINKKPHCFRYAINNGCPWPAWLTWELRTRDP